MRKTLNSVLDNKRNLYVICLILAAITFSVYFQVSNHPFCNFDDDFYVGGNRHVTGGITTGNIIWAFTTVHAGNWHPLTWLSLMADGQFYGGTPHGYHTTNLIIHILSSLVLFVLLFRTTESLWKSAFTAAMFALHPLHVESVAWITERKDVLSAFFCFLTLALYSGYVTHKKDTLYTLTAISFALGLLSKSMLVTVPVVMLFMDFWPLHRYENRVDIKQFLSLIKEKIAFFLLSLLVGLATIYAQHEGGATRDFSLFPLSTRIENALVSYVKYIWKTIWPADLAVFYPYPSSIPVWKPIGAFFILLVLSIVVIHARRRYPYLLVGWSWFMITLMPVIGVFQVGDQAMADRYSYIPIVGLFIIISWGASDMTKRLSWGQGALCLIAVIITITSAVLTSKQVGYWKDDISLYRHSLQNTDKNYILHFNLGLALDRNGQIDEAISEYETAIQIEPRYFLPYSNLGICLAKKGHIDDAIEVFRAGIKIDPDDRKIRNNLNVALSLKEQQLR